MSFQLKLHKYFWLLYAKAIFLDINLSKNIPWDSHKSCKAIHFFYGITASGFQIVLRCRCHNKRALCFNSCGSSDHSKVLQFYPDMGRLQVYTGVHIRILGTKSYLSYIIQGLYVCMPFKIFQVLPELHVVYSQFEKSDINLFELN